jgi:hypothetical protein
MTTRHSRHLASWLAAGAFASSTLLVPATAMAASSTGVTPDHQTPCSESLFSWDVASGWNAYPMLTVHIHATQSIPEGCQVSFSLNAYTTQGPTWATSGTQSLYDHQSVTLSANKTSATLTVGQPLCYGQTDFYTGTTRFDGTDGQLPHYPSVVTPTGLIAYSNGGAACEQPSEQPSASPSEQPSEQPSASPSEQPSEQPSESPSEQPSASPSEQPSASPSEQPSEQPSESPSDQPSASPSSSPSGSVLSETGTPQLTPPPTDTTAGPSNTSGSGWELLLLAIAGMVASIVVLTPATARKRR